MIESLTPEQEARLVIKRDLWLDRVFKYQNLQNWNPEKIQAAVSGAYKLCELNENVKVIEADSPAHAKKIYTELTGDTSDPNLGYYLDSCDSGWLAFYEYLDEEFPGIIEADLMEKFNTIKACAESGIFMSIQLEDYFIAIKPPCEINRDEEFRLHNVNGPAIRFIDGQCKYYVHGRNIEKEIYEAIETIENAGDIFKAEQNEDIKSCIATIVRDRWGSEAMMQMLGATLYKHEHVVHSPTYEEDLYLYKTKEKFQLMDSKGNVDEYPYAWLQYTCPSTGTVYLLDTYPDYESPLEAAKFHRPAAVPFEVPYDWNLFAN